MSIRVRFPTSTGFIEIGDGLPTHLIAEIGLNHNGSEELAQDMIKQAAMAGAGFVKFQKRSPSDLSTSEFLDSPFEKCPSLGSTQREVRERLELSLESYKRLRAYAEQLGLVFFASAFDLQSIDFLLEAGVKIFKIASHSLTNGPLLRRLSDLKVPVIASLGGTTLRERDQAIDMLNDNACVLLHCVSAYPTPDNMATLDSIGYLRERYGKPVGFSSHEVGVDISIAASVLGACMVERHFTINKSMIGLDQAISLDPTEFSEMASKIRRLRVARGILKEIHESEIGAKLNYHVAICTKHEIPAGTKITSDMLVCKQPLADPSKFFSGLEFESVVGKIAVSSISADTRILRESLSG